MRRLVLMAGSFLFWAGGVWARPNFGIDSLSYRFIPTTQGCWGYVDPINGKEYALICARDRLEIWEITDPTNPVRADVEPAFGFDLKQVRPFSHYVMAVNQAGAALQVIDMAPLANNLPVGTVRTFNAPGASGAHTVHIDGNYAYLGMNGSASDWRIIDISDPLNPFQVGTYMTSIPSSFIEQSHDSYVKGDTAYVAFLSSGFSIVDITNRAAPVRISDVSYPPPILTHNCWTTEDRKFLFTTDEATNGHLRVWDVRDPKNPRQVAEWMPPGVEFSIIHNVQVKGNFLYASYYAEGVEILDIEDPTQPIEVGHYDTDPLESGAGFKGCWDFFPFFPSGTLVASNYFGGADPGMWLLRFNGKSAAKFRGTVRNLANGAALPGVEVRLLDAARQVATDSAGAYLIRSEGGPQRLEFSRSGFKAETLARSAVLGDTTTVDVNLAPLFSGVLTGKVLDARTGLPIAGARVGLLGDEFFQDVTDAAGNFSLSFLPTGQPVQIASALWGFQEGIDTLNLSPGAPQDTVFRLGRGYTDDFEFELGWSTSAPDDDAVSGFWERVAPVAAFNSFGFQTQAGADHTPDSGRVAFITGQALPNSSFGDHDVDGGKVTLTTPLFELTEFNKPELSYWRWYSTAGGANGNQDTLFVDISTDSGASWQRLEPFRFSATTWQFRRFQLRGLVPLTNKMLVRFVAADRGAPSNVEAGVDDFRIVETLVTGDVDGNGRLELADVQTLINGTFLGTPAIAPERGDFTGDCRLTSADVVKLLNHFFLDVPLRPTCLP